MKGRNVCTFIGNMGQTPEVKYTTTGTARTNFSIAVNKRWTDGQETKEKTTWVSCIAWGKTAELVGKYLQKGDPVHIEAEYELNEYTDQSQVKQKHPQFVVQDVIFLGSKRNDQPGGERRPADDIPF
jgi:single-strand DNA-binding protein